MSKRIKNLTNQYSPETIKRKVMFEINRLRKAQIDDLSRKIARIEADRTLDDNDDVAFQLAAMKEFRTRQLTAWKHFRTKRGLNNDTVNEIY